MGGCCIGDIPVLREIKDFFSGLFCSDTGCSYHPGPSENEKHAKKIADELAEMKEYIRKTTEKDEEELLDYINRDMTSLLSELEKLNNEKYGGESLHINIDGIRKANEHLAKQVKGFIGNVMDERLVLKDKDLSIILEERDDKKRGKNFDAFVVKLKKQALEKLKQQFSNTVKEQSIIVKKEIQSRLNAVEHRMDESKRAYQQIIEDKKEGGGRLEETRMEHVSQYTLYQLIVDQLEG